MTSLGGSFPASPSAIVTMAVLAFTMGGVSACGEEEETQYVYCINEQGEVVDPALCREDHYTSGGVIYPYYLWSSTTHYPVGKKVPSGWEKTRARPTDTAAREKAGLPPKGSVGGHTIKSGGAGKGSSGGSRGTESGGTGKVSSGGSRGGVGG